MHSAIRSPYLAATLESARVLMTENGLFVSSFLEIEKGWIDYNNHLNMGYYTVIFDRATDQLWDWLGFGERYVAETNHTTFAAEFHVRYLKEVKLGDKLYSVLRVVDHDEKRFHTFQQLYHEDGWLAATGEGLTLHVNLDGPKVAPMPEHIQARIREMAEANARQPQPDGIGRKIGIKRKATSG